MNKLFFIPFFTTIHTRYHSLNKVIVYFITYVIPEFLIVFLMNAPSSISNWKLYFIFSISFISFVNLYEIGYIYNETETIKKEQNPTKRLSDLQLDFYERHKTFIYIERVFLTLFLNTILHFLITLESLILFSMIEFVTLGIFFLYNSVRGGRITQVIYFFLSSTKYSAPIFCFCEKINLSVIIACIFMFPIVRTLEYKAHYGTESNVNSFFRKYIIKYDIQKIPVFRVWATFVLLILSIVLFVFNVFNLLPAIMCGYMFFYRFSLWLAVKLGAQFKGYLQTDKQEK